MSARSSLKNTLLSGALGILFLGSQAGAARQPFQDVPESALANGPGLRTIAPDRARTMRVDVDALRRTLFRAPMEGTAQARSAPLVLDLPWPDGSERRFAVVESPILEPALAAKFPELRTWRGQGLDNRAASVRLDLTPAGFHAQVLGPEGTVYIDPYRAGDPLHAQSVLEARPSADCGLGDAL